MILRVYKIDDKSWVSPGALLVAMKTDDKIKVVKHHPDVNIEVAVFSALKELRRNINKVIEQTIVTMLWSWTIALLILWPPIFHAMLPEASGAIWIGAGICMLISWMVFVRAQLDRRRVDRHYMGPRLWVLEDGPTLLPPVVAWRNE